MSSGKRRHSGKHTRPETTAGSSADSGGSLGWGLVCADDSGEFWDVPGCKVAGRSGCLFRLPNRGEISPLPEGSVLQYMPDRFPLGWSDRAKLQPQVVGDGLALAAQLPSGWVRTLLPAWQAKASAPDLPIFGYTAVGVWRDELYCAAIPVEQNPRWLPEHYALPSLGQKIESLKQKLPGNRLLGQLEVCACEYGCYNAQNIFYERWEGAVPVSPTCNARCRGCISYQSPGMPPSPQVRLNFVPSVEEIVQLGLHHLSSPEAILTFGQGCEGEPLLQGSVIAEAIKQIRAANKRGTLHVNTNGSLYQQAQKVIEAGLTSIRVSLNSVIEEHYQAYYQPSGYSFSDVVKTIDIARANGVWVSLNLLTMPGLTDMSAEVRALIEFVNQHDVNMIQIRNLNMDPDMLFAAMGCPSEASLGIPQMIAMLRDQAPKVRIGAHNPAVGG